MSAASEIIDAALNARTLSQALYVDELIAKAVGGEFERAVGDRVNNHGLLATAGSYDFTLIENITNMQDALLEREAAARFGDTASVPYVTPHEAAAELLIGIPEAELAGRASVEFCEAGQPARKSKRIIAVFRDQGCGIEPHYVADSIFALGSAHKEKVFWQQGAFGMAVDPVAWTLDSGARALGGGVVDGSSVQVHAGVPSGGAGADQLLGPHDRRGRPLARDQRRDAR